MSTEMEQDELESDEVFSASGTPGSILKAERERQGLTEKSVADQLHITMHYVRAIETDQYEKLPGTVFAKGYIKSYAALLQLNEDDIVRRYEEYTVFRDEENQQVRQRTKSRKDKDNLLPWLIFAIFAFVAGFVSLWVYDMFLAKAEPAGNDAAVLENSASGVVNAVTGRLDIDRPVGSEDRSPSQESLAPALPPTDSIQQDRQAPLVIATESGQGNSEGSEGATDEGRLVEVFNVGQDRLQISFSGVCWIELKDSGSGRVYRDIHGAGDQLQIVGTAPFNILLGDAPHATIRLNNDIIDVQEHLRIDNSARLVVGL